MVASGLRFVQKALYQSRMEMQSAHRGARSVEGEECDCNDNRERSSEFHEFDEEREELPFAIILYVISLIVHRR
jgi:hypothetical protein